MNVGRRRRRQGQHPLRTESLLVNQNLDTLIRLEAHDTKGDRNQRQGLALEDLRSSLFLHLASHLNSRLGPELASLLPAPPFSLQINACPPADRSSTDINHLETAKHR